MSGSQAVQAAESAQALITAQGSVEPATQTASAAVAEQSSNAVPTTAVINAGRLWLRGWHRSVRTKFRVQGQVLGRKPRAGVPSVLMRTRCRLVSHWSMMLAFTVLQVQKRSKRSNSTSS